MFWKRKVEMRLCVKHQRWEGEMFVEDRRFEHQREGTNLKGIKR